MKNVIRSLLFSVPVIGLTLAIGHSMPVNASEAQSFQVDQLMLDDRIATSQLESLYDSESNLVEDLINRRDPRRSICVLFPPACQVQDPE